jgi:hypothetical protein
MFIGLLRVFLVFVMMFSLLIGPYFVFTISSAPTYASLDEIKRLYPNYDIKPVQNSFFLSNILVLENAENDFKIIKTTSETYKSIELK